MKWKSLSARERDALVAEKIFGWQEQPCDLEASDDELTIYDSGGACCPRCGAHGHINTIEHGMLQPAHYTTSWEASMLVIQQVRQRLYSKRRYFWQEVQRIISRRIHVQHGLVDWPDAFFFLAPDIVGLAALRTYGIEIEEKEEGAI